MHRCNRKEKKMNRVLALVIALITAAVPMHTAADDGMELIRTTVYYAPAGAKTATGKTARYGHIAYKPEYFGRTCILYTQDTE